MITLKRKTKTEQNNGITMFNNEETGDWGYPILQEKCVAKC